MATEVLATWDDWWSMLRRWGNPYPWACASTPSTRLILRAVGSGPRHAGAATGCSISTVGCTRRTASPTSCSSARSQKGWSSTISAVTAAASTPRTWSLSLKLRTPREATTRRELTVFTAMSSPLRTHGSIRGGACVKPAARDDVTLIGSVNDA